MTKRGYKRVTLEVEEELHTEFKAVATLEKTDVSKLIREFMIQHVKEFRAKQEENEKPSEPEKPAKWTAAYAREHNRK